MEIISKIMVDVLTALYQLVGFSIILSILFMFVYKQYSSEDGKLSRESIKSAVRDWVEWFKRDAHFRRIFFLTFYTVMILFRTLLNRNLWANPLSNVIGTWGLYNEKGNLTTECMENLILFVPFAILLLWSFQKKLVPKLTLPSVLWKSTKIAFLFSFTIEMLQLFLRLGTWQLSDIFYNTLGGALGGMLYYIAYRIKHRKSDSVKYPVAESRIDLDH